MVKSAALGIVFSTSGRYVDDVIPVACSLEVVLRVDLQDWASVPARSESPAAVGGGALTSTRKAWLQEGSAHSGPL